MDFSATYKVLVLGDSNVGKTCIVHRYCDERYYDTYISTIGKNPIKCMNISCNLKLEDDLSVSREGEWNANIFCSSDVTFHLKC